MNKKYTKRRYQSGDTDETKKKQRYELGEKVLYKNPLDAFLEEAIIIDYSLDDCLIMFVNTDSDIDGYTMWSSEEYLHPYQELSFIKNKKSNSSVVDILQESVNSIYESKYSDSIFDLNYKVNIHPEDENSIIISLTHGEEKTQCLLFPSNNTVEQIMSNLYDKMLEKRSNLSRFDNNYIVKVLETDTDNVAAEAHYTLSSIKGEQLTHLFDSISAKKISNNQLEITYEDSKIKHYVTINGVKVLDFKEELGI